jgi:hypothetical protein
MFMEQRRAAVAAVGHSPTYLFDCSFQTFAGIVAPELQFPEGRPVAANVRHSRTSFFIFCFPTSLGFHYAQSPIGGIYAFLLRL